MTSNQIHVSEAEKRILTCVKDEFFPLLKRMRDILVQIQRCRISFQIYSKTLSVLDKEYAEVSSALFAVIRKLQTPDLLLQGLGGDIQNIVPYFRYQEAFQRNIAEAIAYTEIIDRTLDRKNKAYRTPVP